jgi:Ni/Co efflux regulator RcnB
MKASLFPALSPALLAAVLITGLTTGMGASPASAAMSFGMAMLPPQIRGLGLIQYGAQAPPPNGYDNRGYDNRDQPPSYGYDNRGRGQYGYDDRDTRGGHKWRPGEVLPPQFLNRVVVDWEERGLSRPPGGHEWVRVGLQFVLVRGRDRMIARILNFD